MISLSHHVTNPVVLHIITIAMWFTTKGMCNVMWFTCSANVTCYKHTQWLTFWLLFLSSSSFMLKERVLCFFFCFLFTDHLYSTLQILISNTCIGLIRIWYSGYMFQGDIFAVFLDLLLYTNNHKNHNFSWTERNHPFSIVDYWNLHNVINTIQVLLINK